MLVYVASYPRSGNKMTREIIETFFETPTTEVYNNYNSKPFAKENFCFTTNWRLPTDNSVLPLWWHQLQRKIFLSNLSLWIALYDLNVPPYTKNCRYLLPGFLKGLTPKNRQILASEESIFFVKTHENPYSEYFDGEYLIQLVRHPGLVLFSYNKYVKNYSKKDKDANLERVIRGEVKFGSWSKWHESWEKIIPSLKDRFLRLRYEDVRIDKPGTCEKIKALTGLDYNLNNQETSLEELRKRNPKLFGFGKVDGWEEYYTPGEIDLLWDLHGVTMQKLCYEKPARF